MSMRIFSLYFTLLVVLVNNATIQGQVPSNPVPPEYDVRMQRLLLYHTGHFIYGITQVQIELDSAMAYAAGIYNLNRLLVYNERYDPEGKSASGKLIGENKIREVKVLLSATPEAGQQQILAELAAYYIFKAGQVKKDLDEADIFIRRLEEVNEKANDRKWNLEAMILDNGVGLPHDFDIKKSKTLGMRLITKELGGTFSIGSYSSGTTMFVLFRERVLRRLREIQHVEAEV